MMIINPDDHMSIQEHVLLVKYNVTEPQYGIYNVKYTVI